MTIMKPTIAFLALFSILLGSMLGMSAVLGDDVHAARHGSGYGVIADG